MEDSPSTPLTVPRTQTSSVATQTQSTSPISNLHQDIPAPKAEVITYSIGIQTTEPWSALQENRSINGFSDSDVEYSPSKARTPRATKRLSRRERDREEDLRQRLRREIEEELRSARSPDPFTTTSQSTQANFPVRALTEDEMQAVTSSEDFLDFVERSSKVIERALDQEYDVLADYAIDGLNGLDEDEDEGYASSRGKKGRRIKEVAQFYDERWSRKRMISDINFSQKVRPSDYPNICQLS